MSLQISDIVLYSHRGERRILSFRKGALNIITGGKGTGKSALVSIVEYCLGSSECGVPEGAIRDTVAWFALRLAGPNEQHFVARQAPAPGAKSNARAHYLVGAALDMPEADQLAASTNIDAVVALLTEAVGIGLNVHEPPAGQTRAPIVAKLNHALAFVFQPQNEVVQPAFLFHRQADNWVAQSIKDTLPYFLGAVSDDYIAKKEALRRDRSRARKLERKIAQAQSVRGDGVGRAGSLVAEARTVGLLPENAEDAETWDVALMQLKSAVNGPVEAQLQRHELQGDRQELNRLMSRRGRLRRSLRDLRDQLQATRALTVDASGFAAEANEQVARLRSIGVVAPEGDAACPVCAQSLEAVVPAADAVRREVELLSAQTSRMAEGNAGVEALALEIEQSIEEVRQALDETNEAIRSVQAVDARFTELKEAATRRAHAVGRISLYLESVPDTEDDSEIRAELARLEKEIGELEAALDDDLVKDKLDSILSVLSRQMTDWAARLSLEHAGVPFRLSPKKLQVIADGRDGPIPMERMGSGANWLGCHLIAHLAIHHWFVTHDRPVPRFLFLDQPSQVYFPAERVDASIDDLTEEDRRAVVEMFEMIRDVVEELSPGFQVIVTEHADLAERWYQDAVAERWRGGEALIPKDWLE